MVISTETGFMAHLYNIARNGSLTRETFNLLKCLEVKLSSYYFVAYYFVAASVMQLEIQILRDKFNHVQ